jgi:uncharacterized membrane protein YfcA
VIVTVFLFFAALLGGALNAVAGGGSFIALPALLVAGVPPVSANATNTLALWPASLSSAWAYRREVSATRTWLASLGGVSLLGGLVGGLLLVRTSDASFLRLLPWLMLLAAVTFTFAGPLQRIVRNRPQHPALGTQHPALGTQHPALGTQHPAPSTWHPMWALVLQLAIAIYGGYFGGGMGIMMLAALSLAGLTDIHKMNGLKSVLSVAINGVSLVEFVALGIVAWTPGLVMVAGGIAGGYAGAATARRVDQRYVRAFIIVIAWSMTVYFFVR